MKIIGIGNLVTDLYLIDDKLIGVCGGKTTSNIISNLSYMGYETTIYGSVGNDIYGKIALDSLKKVGVDISNILIQDSSTKRVYITLETKRNKYIIHDEMICPLCGGKNKRYKPYDLMKIISSIDEDDIIVIDDLNNTNLEISRNVKNKIMLDLGNCYQFLYVNNKEIIDKLNNSFTIVNMNEKVGKYLLRRFNIKSYIELYNLINTKLLIITKGNKGADFIFNNKIISKELINKEKEIDPSGAGDAFFSVIISEYINNKYKINEKMIDNAFNKATLLTKQVVSKIGARSHIIPLYEATRIKDKCICEEIKIKNSTLL
jgi:sugar/nucleoside kinase (ribokinase family)